MSRWSRSAPKSRHSPCNMSRYASWSPTESAPPGPDRGCDALTPCAAGACCDMAMPEQRLLRETPMSVDGNWKITMSTPMGERNADLTLQSSGGTLTGTQGADGQSGAIFDGTVKDRPGLAVGALRAGQPAARTQIGRANG